MMTAPSPAVPEAAATTPPVNVWDDRIKTFATAVGKETTAITDALKELVGEPGPDALGVLSDSTAVLDTDLQAALVAGGPKIPLGVFRKNLAKLRGPQAAPETATAGVPASAASTLSILPALPDETSFVEMLKTGGVLKVGITEVLAAVKAALAKKTGLFDLTDRILEAMEAFATAQEEPVGESFFKLQKLLTEKKYGDVLSALGVPGSYVSERRKKEFFERLDARLWKALAGFQDQLVAWQNAWTQGMANPGMLVLAMTSRSTGAALPPGMLAPPDTAPLRAAGEEVVNEINRVFAGPGIPVARALAYDATRILGILNEPSLPAQMGMATRDMMLKELGIAVGADIVRTEQGLTRYALAVMSLSKVTADSELAYLAALFQLGSTIPWNTITTEDGLGSRAGIGRTPARNGGGRYGGERDER